MRIVGEAATQYISGRRDIATRYMLYVHARNRSTGAIEPVGLWQGDDHINIVMSGEARLYYGAGNIVQIEPIVSGVGLDVRMQRVTVCALTNEAAELIRGYDTRLCDAQIHRAFLSLETGDIAFDPIRVFSGTVDAVRITTGEIGGAGSVEITLASAARNLTRPLNITKSDANMRRRNPQDSFRTYTDISGEVGVWWGEKKGTV